MGTRLIAMVAGVAVSVAFFLLSASAAHAESSSVMIVSNVLNERSAPSTSSAVVGRLYAGNVVSVNGTVHGEEVAPGNDVWFSTADGRYIYSGGTASYSEAPSASTVGDSSARWIDANLRTATVSAMVGNTVVFSARSTIGTANHPTPAGNFVVLRRVYDETMDSSTIGIPRNAPGGYYLRHVLYTQYFTGAGHALHYNYWSPASAFGSRAGSHGCLGLTLAASKYFWDFATVGTPVIIHY